MFDFLKGGKATLTVSLDRTNRIYAPGETIHVTVNVQGVKDLKIQSGKIALVSLEEYEYRYESRDSDGDTSTTTTKTTDQVKVWEQQFLGETTIKTNSTENFEFNISIPAKATPTVADGKILNLTWLVKTTLDRKLAGDVEDKQELYILAPLSGTSSGPGDFGISNEPGEAEMLLRLSKREFALGETISGELILRPKKQFDVTEIRVELVRLEDVPRDEGNQFKQDEKVKLAAGTKLTPGQEMTFPFQIKIPTLRPITANTRHGTINWSLRGVLSRRMRGDTLVEQEVLIYNAA